MNQFTKEWIRMVLAGEKKLLPLKAVKLVDVGHYPELSVKKLYQEFAERKELQPYLPPKLAKGRQLDKKYFWNVVNTLFEDELQSMLQHANSQRNQVGEQQEKNEAIKLSNEMAEAMNQFPWVVSTTFSEAYRNRPPSFF